ncbi:MAG: arginine--tRNA ligase [Firmicutes bacterium]|nr:arginine--tRNA ligase [Bacillota bacterium]
MLVFKEKIGLLLSSLTGLDPAKAASSLEIPPEPGLGEYAFPCFILARSLKKSPQAIASELAGRIEPTEYLKKVESVGPYLNFYVHRPHLFFRLSMEIAKQDFAYGRSEEGQGQTIVIDYSAPNIAKPFGIGHLRSTVIGNSLYRLYENLGYRVIGINHLGDWGTQFGKLIVAYRKWGDSSRLEKDPVRYLYELYVLFHKEAEENPDLEEEARLWFRNLEMDDEEAVQIWKNFRALSLEDFKRLYNFLGIQFDSYKGESFYNPLLEKTIRMAQEKGLAKESEGALIADLEPHGLPPCLLRKKDGAALYITRDLAAAIYRYEQYRFDKIYYVVGSEQTLHFQQLFKILELMGYPWAQNCFHVPFGLIHFEDGRMSTREGRVILLEDVLNRATKIAHSIIREKNPDLQRKEKAAHMVGLGAVIFGDLINDRVKDIEFDWDKVLDFSGETAPYIQYAHARICSIFRKAESEGENILFPLKDDFPILTEIGFLDSMEEEQLLITLSRFQEQIGRAAQDCRPSYLARYLVDLARDFNRFYHNCPVLTAEQKLKRARLALIKGVQVVLHNGLKLLGIEAPQEM